MFWSWTLVYIIFYSFHPSKFHLNKLRHHTPSSAIYIFKNRMQWGEGVPIVKLEDSNKMHFWIKATKSQVLTGYWAHDIWELPSEFTVSVKGPSNIIQEWKWHHTLVWPQNEVKLSGFFITAHVKMAELGLSNYQDDVSHNTLSLIKNKTIISMMTFLEHVKTFFMVVADNVTCKLT